MDGVLLVPMLGFIVPSGSEFFGFGAEAAILDFERLARALFHSEKSKKK